MGFENYSEGGEGREGERLRPRVYIYLDWGRYNAFWEKILVVYFRHRVQQVKLTGLYEIYSINSSLS